MKVWVAYANKQGNKRLNVLHWTSNLDTETFFSECINQTSQAFDLEKLEFCVTNSDVPGWCKNHALDALVDEKVHIISKLDVYRVNQKVYRAFSSQTARAYYLDLLYLRRDFDGLLMLLSGAVEQNPTMSAQNAGYDENKSHSFLRSIAYCTPPLINGSAKKKKTISRHGCSAPSKFLKW